MNNLSLSKMKEDLQNILYIFSEFYKYPTSDFIYEIHSGQLDQDLEALFSNVQFSILPNVKEKVQTGIDLTKQYQYCFSGIKKPFVTPVESIYMQWTYDTTVQLPIVSQTGYLMSDSALHMRHLFEKYGVEIPEEYRYMPDHITLQLEFLAMLLEYSDLSDIKQFIEDHLNWIPKLLKDLQPLDDSSFYIYITTMLQKFLEHYDYLLLIEIGERSESYV